MGRRKVYNIIDEQLGSFYRTTRDRLLKEKGAKYNPMIIRALKADELMKNIGRQIESKRAIIGSNAYTERAKNEAREELKELFARERDQRAFMVEFLNSPLTRVKNQREFYKIMISSGEAWLNSEVASEARKIVGDSKFSQFVADVLEMYGGTMNEYYLYGDRGQQLQYNGLTGEQLARYILEYRDLYMRYYQDKYQYSGKAKIEKWRAEND